MNNKQIVRILEKYLIVFGTITLVLLPFSISPAHKESSTSSNDHSSLKVSWLSAAEISPLAETFIGSDVSLDEIQTIVSKQKAFVSSRKAFPAAYRVIKKHEATIRHLARVHGVPEDVALGIGLLENGGSEDAVSTAGARGVFQLMPGTARNLGLVVKGDVDERSDPEKNINAGMMYLKMNHSRFGDWGFSAWAYHAGEGNVVKALKAYAQSNYDIELPGVEDFQAHRQFIRDHNLTIHKLLSDPAVQEFTAKLNDDSAGYAYKVVATAKLFQEDYIMLAND